MEEPAAPGSWLPAAMRRQLLRSQYSIRSDGRRATRTVRKGPGATLKVMKGEIAAGVLAPPYGTLCGLETTLIILKPDAIDRRLVGEIVARFERKGLVILGLKMVVLTRELAEKHYEAHRSKPFYKGLLDFMTGGPVVLMALAGEHAIEVARKLMGETAGWRSLPGTVRGDYALSEQSNLIHGSDSPEAAARELRLFFRPEELVDYRTSDGKWFARA